MSELTLQLTTQNLNPSAVDLFTIINWRETGKLDLDAPYQRGVVWGQRRRRNFIRSLLTGIPIPAVMINDRLDADFTGPADFTPKQNIAKAIVDGKQRLTSVFSFIDNDLAIPASWYDADAADDAVLHWEDLPVVAHRKFENIVIPVVRGSLATLDDERDLFDLINYGGIPQGEADDDI